MGFDISFGSKSSGLNIGFHNPNGMDVNFGNNTPFDIDQESQQNMNAGFNSGGQLNTGFSSNSPMNAEFETCGIIYYDTEENWNRKETLISIRKAIYVYSDHSVIQDEYEGVTYIPALKIGDGVTLLIHLPFVSDDIRERLASHIFNYSVHVSDHDRSFWNNKVGAYVLTNRPNTLILSKIINM